MKLNLWVFHDWLSDFHPKITCTTPKRELIGIRIYQPDQPELDDVLYLGCSDDFFHDGQRNVVCKTKGDFLSLETEDLVSVLNSIQSAFSFYSKWYDSCLEDIARDCSLNELVTRANEVFSMPLMIVNVAQMVVANSSSLEDVVAPEDWNNVQTRNSLPEEKLKQFNQSYKVSFYNTEIYMIPKGIFPTKSYCKHIFSQDGERLGTAILKVADEDTSYSNFFLFHQFMTLVDQWVRNSKYETNAFYLSSFFAAALDGNLNVKETMHRQLSLFNWEPDCRKQVLILFPCAGQFRFSMHLSRELTNEDLGVFLIPYHNRMVLLCNLDMVERDRFFQRLPDILSEYQYSAACSYLFTDLDGFLNAYEQAQIVEEYSPKTAGKIFHSQDIAMLMTEQLIREHATVSLLHPTVSRLAEYDRDHATQLYATMFAYLRNERRHQQTAEELYIHRNTLSLRLEKIQELCPMDLENPEERFHLLFSFYQDNVNKLPDNSRGK